MPDLLQPGINALGKYMKTKIATFIGLFLTLYLYYIRRLVTEFKFCGLFLIFSSRSSIDSVASL